MALSPLVDIVYTTKGVTAIDRGRTAVILQEEVRLRMGENVDCSRKFG